MKTGALRSKSEPLPRRDIIAICAFLNRGGSRSIDGSGSGVETHLDRLAAAAGMQ